MNEVRLYIAIIIEAIKEPFYLYEEYGLYGLKQTYNSWSCDAIIERAKNI